MIVVDTNVIAHLMLPGDATSRARGVLRKDADWSSPLLWRSEFRNILGRYVRQGHLQLPDALEIMEEAERLLRGGEYAVRSSEVLRLVSISRCSAYDCEFVALAEDLAVPLVTRDRRLPKEFPSIAVSVEDFVDRP